MTRRLVRVAALLLVALQPGVATAAREAVLKQIDLPHSYYWRELYLPQLTTGPSSLAFMPDGKSLIYSMAGSLWRQALEAEVATELTHARGAYDYQPDIARDGRSVVFVRYDGRAMELWRLDLASGRETALTTNGAVNVEPRISPDGRRLAWVSTAGTGHFNLFVANLDDAGIHDMRAVPGPRRSEIDRYYYSAFDHAVNPAWTQDGRSLVFVTNREVAWGSGDLWIVPLDEPSQARQLLAEETTWAARPEPAPHGERVLYSSYRGRAWHQLWLTTLEGSPPLPLTFGDFDARNARWSSDGRRVAYISNERGNTSLVLQETIGGARRFVEAPERATRLPQGTLELDIRDERGEPVPARVAVMASDGRAYAPRTAWMHGDDGFDRALQPMETHYFHCGSPCVLDVPAGRVTVDVQYGDAHVPWHRDVDVAAGRSTHVVAALAERALPAEFGPLVSADLHVHMNYGGHYRNTPAHLVEQARAEDLDVIYDLIVNKEERVPDMEYFRAGPDPASTPRTTIFHSQEFHTSYWGHLGLLNLGDHLVLPDFTSYRHTALGSPYPHNGVIADLAHAQGGLVGYVHPYDSRIVPEKETSLTHALPADVMAGKVDYLEVVGFSDHQATAEVWYRLLNLGFHLPGGAGTDAMANYASLRGPVGLNRVFLRTAGKRDAASLAKALREGRGFVTNGPLLGLDLAGRQPGDTLPLDPQQSVKYRVALRSIVPVDHLELVHDGRVVKTFSLTGEQRTSFDAAGELRLAQGGWLLLRAWNDGSHPRVLDLYPYATTNPVYLDGPAPPPDVDDARYFVAWLDRVLDAASARTDYNDDDERRATLDYLRAARDEYATRATATAPEMKR